MNTEHGKSSVSAAYRDGFCFECISSRRMLRLSTGIDVIGPVMWDLALSLLLAWIISFLCMIKGIKTTGKVFQ
jgi:Sodium:neurotransmitter symporter family